MKYSHLIKSLKYLFLFFSVTIFTILIFKGLSQRTGTNKSIITFESEEINSTAQVLKKPLFVGLDKKQQPFKISADKAVRYNINDNIFNLEEPKGEIETNSEKFFVFGNKGVFDNNNQTLVISGEVEFTNKDSMKFNTTEAKFDFKKQVLSGENSITGKRNDSIIKSEGFKILNKENKIIFTGKSYLTLNQ